MRSARYAWAERHPFSPRSGNILDAPPPSLTGRGLDQLPLEVLISSACSACSSSDCRRPPRGVLAYCSVASLCALCATCSRLFHVIDVRAAPIWQWMLRAQRARECVAAYRCASISGQTPELCNVAHAFPVIGNAANACAMAAAAAAPGVDGSDDSGSGADEATAGNACAGGAVSAKARFICYDALRQSWTKLLEGAGSDPRAPPPYTASVLGEHTDCVRCVHLAGSRIVTAASSDQMFDCSVKVWCARTGRCIRTFLGHRGTILAIAVFDNASRAISASQDTTLRLLELNSGITSATFEGHTAPVHCVSVHRNGREFVSGSNDCTLRVWDIDLRVCRHVLPLTEVSIGVQFVGDRFLLAYGGGGVSVWDKRGGGGMKSSGGVDVHVLADRSGSDRITCACFAEGVGAAAGRIALGSSMGSLSLLSFDGADGRISASGSFSSSPARPSSDSSSDEGGSDSAASLPSSSSSTTSPLSQVPAVTSVDAHAGAVWCMQWIGDETLVSGGDDGQVCIWHCPRRGGELAVKLLRALKGHTAAVVTLQATARFILSGSFDGTVRLWDAASGACLVSCDAHSSRVWCVAMNSSYIVSAALDTQICVRRLHACGDAADPHTVAAVRSSSRVHAQARELRRCGNAAYRAGRHCDAVEAYSHALALGDDPVLLSNRAAALTAAGRLTEALVDAQRCCELRPGWHKGHYRLSRVRDHLNRARRESESESYQLPLVEQQQQCGRSTPLSIRT